MKSRIINSTIANYVWEALYGIALIIFIIDTAHIIDTGIVVTVGRISFVGSELYTYSGNLYYDFVLILTLITSSLLIFVLTNLRNKISNYVYVFIPLLIFFTIVLFFKKLNIIISYIFISVSIFFSGIRMFGYRTNSLKKLVRSFIIGLSINELQKIIYLLIKGIIGKYPPIVQPVYVNTVLFYITWFLIPVSLILFLLLSIIRLSTYFLKGTFLLEVFKTRMKCLASTIYSSNNYVIKYKYFVIIGSLLLSLLLPLITYLPTLNPMNYPTNTDWIYYYTWLNRMIRGDFSILLERSDRILYLLILYLIWLLTKIDPRTIAIYHYIFLLPIYTFSIYRLGKEWGGEKIGLYSALITPFSPIFISFLYGGFQSNLLALSLIFIAISMLISNNTKRVVWGGFLYTITMFIHEWTWIQYTIILFLYITLRKIHNILKNDAISTSYKEKILVLFISFNTIVYTVKYFFLNSTIIDRVAYLINVTSTNQSYLESLHWYYTIFTGGSLDNPVFFLGLLYGVDIISLDIPSLSIILSIIPTIFSESVITYRLLLNTPLQVVVGKTLFNCRDNILRILIIIILIGNALWRIYSIIPGLSLTP